MMMGGSAKPFDRPTRNEADWSNYKESDIEFFNSNHDRMVEIMRMISPKSVSDKTKVRIGSSNDGGYVMLDEILKSGKIAYSIGIGNTIKFEEAVEALGYKIWMYDHTVNGKKFKNENRTIFKIGIAPADAGKYKTLSTMIKDNGHENEENMVLQMDVEGAEWEVLSRIDPDVLSKFSIMNLEIHWMNTMFARPDTTEMIDKSFQALTKNHTVFHVHANNWCGYYEMKDKPPLAEVLEISLVKNDLVNLVSCNEEFPGPLDSPNKKGEPDINLGDFQW